MQMLWLSHDGDIVGLGPIDETQPTLPIFLAENVHKTEKKII